MSENRIIGRQNRLPWRLPDEMAYFRRKTYGCPVLMGRSTFESMDCNPLPGRHNIVVTRHVNRFSNVATVQSLPDGIQQAEHHATRNELFVIGGAGLYRAALPLADRLYCTILHAQIDGDVEMPAVDFSQWQLRSQVVHGKDPLHAYAFTMYTFDRNGC